MKPNYRKVPRWYRPRSESDYVYDHVSGNYMRRMQTFGELRRNCQDVSEFGTEVKGVGRRGDDILNPWNNERVPSRNFRRSWKEFTRHRKQWMISSDTNHIHD